jgi:hypothetical protein
MYCDNLARPATLQRTVIRPLTQPIYRGVRPEALAIRFSFPMWRTVSSARRDGIPEQDLVA